LSSRGSSERARATRPGVLAAVKAASAMLAPLDLGCDDKLHGTAKAPNTPQPETVLFDFDGLEELDPLPPPPPPRPPPCKIRRWVLIRPVNGLCNRLSAVVSAWLLAEDLGRELAVDWCLTPACGCPWDRLFSSGSGAHFLTQQLLETEPSLRAGFEIMESIFKSVDQGRFSVEGPATGRTACWLDLDHDSPRQWQELPRLVGVPDQELPSSLRATVDCAVCTHFAAFYPPGRKDLARTAKERRALLHRLRPVPGVEARLPRLKSGTVGVHIRRGDHEISRRHSPDELFIAALDSLFAVAGEGEPQRAAADIFLATDDPVLEETLRCRYSGQVSVVTKRSLDRSQPESIEDALVDLLSLSQCSQVFGSHDSTFSSTAAFYRGVPLTILRAGAGARSQTAY